MCWTLLARNHDNQAHYFTAMIHQFTHNSVLVTFYIRVARFKPKTRVVNSVRFRQKSIEVQAKQQLANYRDATRLSHLEF